MDLLQHARALYAAGRMHDALEAARAACDRAPKDAEAWLLLGRVGRHTGLPAASDEAFRRASALDARLAPPHRVSPQRFRALVEEVAAALAAEGRGPGPVEIGTWPLPTTDQVRAGVDPDALSARGGPEAVLLLFQVNHENRCPTEEALRDLLRRSLLQEA
jgi:tetratricopeptide (TPR) repeat protein